MTREIGAGQLCLCQAEWCLSRILTLQTQLPIMIHSPYSFPFSTLQLIGCQNVLTAGNYNVSRISCLTWGITFGEVLWWHSQSFILPVRRAGGSRSMDYSLPLETRSQPLRYNSFQNVRKANTLMVFNNIVVLRNIDWQGGPKRSSRDPFCMANFVICLWLMER